jgi:DNA polymerase III delta prime subunit
MAVKDIAGNTMAKKIILSTVQGRKFGTAFLFAGEGNIGKNFAARQFAKVMNCLDPKPDSDCCDECASCKLIDRVIGGLDEEGMQQYPHPDVKYINTDKAQLVVSMVRDELNSFNAYKGVHLRKKILIIQDAERMNKESSNSILKELEEPNDNVLIILIVNQLDRMLPTIISRCRRIDIGRATTEEIEKRLKKVMPDWDEKTVKQAALFSEGRMGEAFRYEEIKLKIAEAAGIFRVMAAKKDDIESIFEAIKAVEGMYKEAQEKEKKEKKSGIARIFLLDILRILSYIYKDLMLEKLSVKSVMRSKYGINPADLREYSVKKIVKITALIEEYQRYLALNANVSLLFNNLFFEIRKEGLAND